jgi:hypothetical protein
VVEAEQGRLRALKEHRAPGVERVPTDPCRVGDVRLEAVPVADVEQVLDPDAERNALWHSRVRCRSPRGPDRELAELGLPGRVEQHVVGHDQVVRWPRSAGAGGDQVELELAPLAHDRVPSVVAVLEADDDVRVVSDEGR